MTESNYFRFNHCIAQEVKFQTRMVRPQEANAKLIMHRSFNWGKLVFVLPILTTAYTLSSLILSFVFLYELIKCFQNLKAQTKYEKICIYMTFQLLFISPLSFLKEMSQNFAHNKTQKIVQISFSLAVVAAPTRLWQNSLWQVK